jgi:hypothetical protein
MNSSLILILLRYISLATIGHLATLSTLDCPKALKQNIQKDAGEILDMIKLYLEANHLPKAEKP